MLNPKMSEEGEDLEDHLRGKYGERGVQMLRNPNAYLYTAGQKVGIEFTNKRKMVRTQKAHALIEYVKEELDEEQVQAAEENTSDGDANATTRISNTTSSLSHKLMEELFCRYFEHGEDINDDDVLVKIASTIGIAETKARDAIEDGRRLWHVDEQDRLYKRGISGVPVFMIDRRRSRRRREGDKKQRPVTFSGALPVDIMAEQLEEAAEKEEE